MRAGPRPAPASSALLLPAARGVRRLHGRDGGVRLLGILQTDLMLARHRKWASCAAVAAGVASTWLTGSCARPAASCANRTSTTESDNEPAPRYSDDAQAGGHVDGVRFMGAMLHKRLQDEGRGDREVAALAALAQSPRWRDYVPRYGGLRTEPAGSESWLVMENLAAGMVRPAVMDIKIGTRHFSSDAPPKKIAKEKKKANTTTIGTHGLRSKR